MNRLFIFYFIDCLFVINERSVCFFRCADDVSLNESTPQQLAKVALIDRKVIKSILELTDIL